MPDCIARIYISKLRCLCLKVNDMMLEKANVPQLIMRSRKSVETHHNVQEKTSENTYNISEINLQQENHPMQQKNKRKTS